MSLLWLALLVPTVAGTVLVLVGPRAERWAVWAGTAAAALTLVVALLLVGRSVASAPPFLAGAPFALGSDGLTAALAVTVCAVTTAVLAAVPAQVTARRARLCGGLLLFLAAVLLTLTARSLLPLIVGWELMGAASYVLIAHDLTDRRAVASATTALLTTRALDLGLYAAAGAALAGGGTLALDGLATLPAGWRDLAAAGVVLAALGKAAQLPVSSWLSRAMDGPSPVSALLHSAAMVAMGGYLLLRSATLLEATSWAPDLLAWVGVSTAVALGVVALAQRDLKQLLAASTASQLGFVVLAAGVGGTGAGAVQLVAHAAVKSLLFLAAGLWLHVFGTRDLAQLRGAARRTPAVGLLAAAGLLALAGVPPLALWTSKDAVLAAALDRSPWLYAVGLLAAGLSAAYAGRALAVLLSPTTERTPLARTAWWPMLPLAAGAVLLAGLVLGPTGTAFAKLLGVTRPGATAVELVVSGVVAVALVAAAWRWGERWPDRLPRAAGQWWHLDAATHRTVVGPVLALSRGLARFDDRRVDGLAEAGARGVRRLAAASGAFDDRRVDGLVEAGARGVRRLAVASGSFDDRRVDGGVSWVAARARRLGTLARRPQTGQVHDYYGLAAAVLGAAVLLLVVVR